MNVYLSCVGEQDPVSPKTGAEGSLLTCFRFLHNTQNLVFRIICLIPTSRETRPGWNTEGLASECAQILQRLCPDAEVQIYPLRVYNAADLKEVFPHMRELVRNILAEVRREANGEHIVWHINTSSATRQMNESLVFLAWTGLFHPDEVKVWQVFDPRGGFTTPEERVQPAPLMDMLTQERFLTQLEQLAQQCLYREMRNILDKLPTRYQDLALHLCDMLIAHDSWQYDNACHHCSRVQQGLSVFADGAFVEPLRQWLTRVAAEIVTLTQRQGRPELQNNEVTKLIIIDRYQTGCRRQVQGLFPDALGHFWTATDMALIFYGKENNCPRDLNESSQSHIGRLRQSTALGRRRITIDGQRRNLLDAVDELRQMRNGVVHGVTPVYPPRIEFARHVTQALLEALGWRREIENYPLSPERISEHLLNLIRAMREALWA